jgi:glutamyl-tRNA synthetase
MFHVGGARSALFNWAVARQSGGRFVLRIEDTDTSRNRPEWTEGILRALAWLGIGPESETFEGPYFQSHQTLRHQQAGQTLLAAGRAYYCGCTREDVAARTADPRRGYDGHCRDLGLPPGSGRALRFRTPGEGTTTVVDLVRGKPDFPNAAMEDFVLVRGDGTATFLLANVVDDIDTGITHVIRAEEHLSNAPKQQLLWEALGAPPPVWAHVPVIVNERRQKLSKRRDKVALEDYQAAGYLPAAMVNYLMLLGWGPRDGGPEIMPWERVEAQFRLEDVTLAPAMFDEKKLRAFNGEYVRALPVAEFAAACQPWLTAPVAPWPADRFDPAAFAAVAPLAQTRVAVLSEVTALVDFLFLDEPPTDDQAWAKTMTGPAETVLADAAAAFTDAEWTAEQLKSRLEAAGARRGLKLGKAQAPVRVAVTGRTVGLPLFESLAVLGRDRTLARLASARDRLARGPAEPSGP